jgi:hypothetical protein
MIVQEFNELRWVLVGVAGLWLLDITYRSVTDKRDAYRYILILLTLLPITILPSSYIMCVILCRYWYSTFRLGFRIGLLYNTHAIMMSVYIIYLSTGVVFNVQTWLLAFSLVDLVILIRKCPRPIKKVLWVLVRIVAFGVYALFFGNSFTKVYFGLLWMVQIFMLPQL